MKFRTSFFRSAAVVLLSLMLLPLFGCTAKYRKARAFKRANEYYAAGDYEKAKIEFLGVLRIDPQSVNAIEHLGLIWFDEGAPIQAFPYLLGAREIAPDALDVRTKLGLAHLTVGQRAEARKEALEILKRDPRQGQAALLLADTTSNPNELAENEQLIQHLPGPDDSYRLQAKASLAARANNFAIARGYLEHALTLDPKSSSAHVGLGMVARATNDTAKAGEEFKAAANLAPPRDPATIRYADFLLSTGAANEAKALLTEATRRAPDFFPAWQMQAQIAALEKDYDRSLALLEHIFSADPQNPDARLLQADNLSAKHNPAEAVKVLERLDSTYKTVPVIKFRLARAYLEQDNRNQAIIFLTQAVNAAPDYLDAVLLLANLNLQGGEGERTVTAMTDLLQRHPRLSAAELLLAEADRALGRLEGAEAVLDGMIKDGTKEAQPYMLMGLVQRQLNRDDRARQYYENALAISPDDLTLLAQIADLDLKENRGAEALQLAQARLAKTPQSPYAMFLVARVYSGLMEWDQAEATLLKALEIEPDYIQAYDLLVTNDVTNGRLDAALDQLKARLAKDPNDQRALMTAALIYDRKREAAKARDMYEKLVALAPNSSSILNNLAYLYSEKLNQLDRAFELASRAHQIAPNDSATDDTLGWILYKRGAYGEALALLQSSSSKLSDDPEIQYHLAMANYSMGHTEAARAAFQRAAASSKDFPGKSDVTQRLALLGDEASGAKPLSMAELERLSKTQGNDPQVWSRLGQAYEDQKNWDRAKAAYEQALKLNPALVPDLVRLAWLYSGPLHDLGKAETLARSARDQAQNAPQVAAVLGHVLFIKGDYAKAYALLQSGAYAQPDDTRILHDLAWTVFFLGRTAESVQLMQSAVKADPAGQQAADAKDFLAMATALDQPSAQKLTAAGPEAARILKAEPANVPALLVQAALHTQNGDTQAAATDYQNVLRLAPEYAPAQKFLAALYLQEPDGYHKAYDLVVRAHAALPSDPEISRVLGQVCYERKEYPYAIQLLQESAGRTPLDAKSLYSLGMCYLQTGQKPQAKDTLQQALKAGLQGPAADAAKKAVWGS